ncbi:MAG: hypothetical protein M9894_18415 [Planctomycetes bacterium]|nr:hypothetical protein [Planctomycetota bacterium]
MGQLRGAVVAALEAVGRQVAGRDPEELPVDEHDRVGQRLGAAQAARVEQEELRRDEELGQTEGRAGLAQEGRGDLVGVARHDVLGGRQELVDEARGEAEQALVLAAGEQRRMIDLVLLTLALSDDVRDHRRSRADYTPSGRARARDPTGLPRRRPTR